MSVDALDPIEIRASGSAGPTIVVLHGGPGAPGSVGALARELGRDSRVIEPLRRRSGAVPLTVERHVADLAAVAPPRATLVGWSWGAMLALSFAARHPERTAAVALIGCGTYDDGSRAEYTLRMEQRLEYVGLPGCGHEPWRERGARRLFFDRLRGWLPASG